jgi:hypothetical protein
MATTEPRPAMLEAADETVYVDRLCDGIIGPTSAGLSMPEEGLEPPTRGL